MFFLIWYLRWSLQQSIWTNQMAVADVLTLKRQPTNNDMTRAQKSKVITQFAFLSIHIINIITAVVFVLIFCSTIFPSSVSCPLLIDILLPLRLLLVVLKSRVISSQRRAPSTNTLTQIGAIQLQYVGQIVVDGDDNGGLIRNWTSTQPYRYEHIVQHTCTHTYSNVTHPRLC